ncbi:hypothetical protein TYRP_013974 [Tyrophagus putrescentiae]|nr:hypothetical protein TYRP_013974 [Tyrophagus putrescentiae]
MLTNVPISASLHSMLLVLYGRLHFAQRAVALNMFALQAVVSVATLTLLGQVNYAIYGCSAPLYSVQAYLKGDENDCCTSTAHLLQKLKILQYYQLIKGYGGGGGGKRGGGGRLKLGYTVGSLANISNHSLFTYLAESLKYRKPHCLIDRQAKDEISVIVRRPVLGQQRRTKERLQPVKVSRISNPVFLTTENDQMAVANRRWLILIGFPILSVWYLRILQDHF